MSAQKLDAGEFARLAAVAVLLSLTVSHHPPGRRRGAPRRSRRALARGQVATSGESPSSGIRDDGRSPNPRRELLSRSGRAQPPRGLRRGPEPRVRRRDRIAAHRRRGRLRSRFSPFHDLRTRPRRGRRRRRRSGDFRLRQIDGPLRDEDRRPVLLEDDARQRSGHLLFGRRG
jgi:hypothetical protein